MRKVTDPENIWLGVALYGAVILFKIISRDLTLVEESFYLFVVCLAHGLIVSGFEPLTSTIWERIRPDLPRLVIGCSFLVLLFVLYGLEAHANQWGLATMSASGVIGYILVMTRTSFVAQEEPSCE